MNNSEKDLQRQISRIQHPKYKPYTRTFARHIPKLIQQPENNVYQLITGGVYITRKFQVNIITQNKVIIIIEKFYDLLWTSKYYEKITKI